MRRTVTAAVAALALTGAAVTAAMPASAGSRWGAPTLNSNIDHATGADRAAETPSQRNLRNPNAVTIVLAGNDWT